MEQPAERQRQVRRLDEDERIETFDCGDDDLDDFIINEAPMYRDTYRSAIPFYEKNGFSPLLTDDDDATTRLMFFDLADYKRQLSKV